MMTNYKTRPGVVLTEIAGEYILVSAKSLLKECPYVTQINESSAFIWKLLEEGCSQETLFEKVCASYDIDDKEDVQESIVCFLEQLDKMKYLTVYKEENLNV